MNKTIAILFSGTGSNLEAICKYIELTHEYKISCTLTNNPNAKGIDVSQRYGYVCEVLDHKGFAKRTDYDMALMHILAKYNVDLVVLAGFMRILTPIFVKSYKMVNIHPSLLPLFAGANAIKESYESKMLVGGVTIHFVNEEVDGGEIIAQEAIQKLPSDTLESFENKIHQKEWEIYPKTISKILKEI